MDWLKDFTERYTGINSIRNLKEKKFIGTLKLNFYKGEVLKVSKVVSFTGRKKEVNTDG